MSLSGWLVIDKPENVTSTFIVNKVKRSLSNFTGKKIKIGHTGTLDPFATGILPLAIGEATKLSQLFLDCDKEYIFTLKWGSRTDTADHTGKVIEENVKIPSLEAIENILRYFIGAISQIPPKYSALKIDGKRAYDLVRKGVDFDLKKRDIVIYSLRILDHQAPYTKFNVKCSKGTYVRTLGEDIATALGCLGHLSALRRQKVGFFSVNNAVFADIAVEVMYEEILDVVSPLDGIPAIMIDADQEHALRHGKILDYVFDKSKSDVPVLAFSHCGSRLVAIIKIQDNLLRSQRVFNL